MKLARHPTPADHRLSPPARAAQAPPLGELMDYVDTLHQSLKALLEVAGDKLQALRVADAPALERLAGLEVTLLKKVLSEERQRVALLARVAQSLQRPDLARSALTEISRCLPEPAASVLRAKSLALRELASELQRKNGIAARVAQNLQSHIRGVFAEVARATQESVGYGSKGRHESCGRRYWVDAVG